jgi:hypothetical protein
VIIAFSGRFGSGLFIKKDPSSDPVHIRTVDHLPGGKYQLPIDRIHNDLFRFAVWLKWLWDLDG